jgi:hypothetical protein
MQNKVAGCKFPMADDAKRTIGTPGSVFVSSETVLNAMDAYPITGAQTNLCEEKSWDFLTNIASIQTLPGQSHKLHLWILRIKE